MVVVMEDKPSPAGEADGANEERPEVPKPAAFAADNQLK